MRLEKTFPSKDPTVMKPFEIWWDAGINNMKLEVSKYHFEGVKDKTGKMIGRTMAAKKIKERASVSSSRSVSLKEVTSNVGMEQGHMKYSPM